jgi:hypothetical protein
MRSERALCEESSLSFFTPMVMSAYRSCIQWSSCCVASRSSDLTREKKTDSKEKKRKFKKKEKKREGSSALLLEDEGGSRWVRCFRGQVAATDAGQADRSAPADGWGREKVSHRLNRWLRASLLCPSSLSISQGSMQGCAWGLREMQALAAAGGARRHPCPGTSHAARKQEAGSDVCAHACKCMELTSSNTQGADKRARRAICSMQAAHSSVPVSSRLLFPFFRSPSPPNHPSRQKSKQSKARTEWRKDELADRSVGHGRQRSIDARESTMMPEEDNNLHLSLGAGHQHLEVVPRHASLHRAHGLLHENAKLLQRLGVNDALLRQPSSSSSASTVSSSSGKHASNTSISDMAPATRRAQRHPTGGRSPMDWHKPPLSCEFFGTTVTHPSGLRPDDTRDASDSLLPSCLAQGGCLLRAMAWGSRLRRGCQFLAK